MDPFYLTFNHFCTETFLFLLVSFIHLVGFKFITLPLTIFYKGDYVSHFLRGKYVIQDKIH